MPRKIVITLLACLGLLGGSCINQAEVKPTGLDPLFPIVKDGKWGYINKTGRIVIKPQYNLADDFSEGLAAVRIGGLGTGKSGYINKAGQIVVEPQFDSAWPFSEGLACILIGKQRGYIDKTGNIVIKPRFNMAYPFSEGLACVDMNIEPETQSAPTAPLKFVQRQWGYIDKTGKVVIEPRFGIAYPFSEGLALVKIGGLLSEDKYGYIDKTGRYKIEPQFGHAEPFSEGLALVKIGNSLKTRCGYIDQTGKMVIKPQYLESGTFSEGLAAVRYLIGGCVYINKEGNAVLRRIQVDDVYRFSEGRAKISIGRSSERGGKYGFINRKGRIVVEPQFSAARDFSNGLAKVWIGDKMGYIDKTGKYIWRPTK